MRLHLLACSFFVMAACAGFPQLLGGGAGKTTAHETSTHSSTHTEEINGEPVEPELPEPPRAHGKSRTVAKAETSDIGKTCHKNAECGADACYVGAGDLGYCTKMCNSWSDCPTHWECEKPGNAPQRICMQDSW